MKKLRIYKKLVLPGCLALVGMLSSCSMFDDFLTVYPTNQITSEQFWEDKNDLTSVVASCYRQLTTDGVSQRMFVWGELRSDNFLLKSESDEDIKNIMNANLLPTNGWYDWSSYYRGIGLCNLVLSKGPSIIGKDPSFTQSDWKPIAAECKTLRALYYFYLIRAFRDVPFNLKASDTSEGARNPMPQVPEQTTLTYLINDLEGCKDDGMTNYGNDAFNACRITKNAIYSLLADMYLWRAAKNTCPDSAAKYPGMAASDYAKCIDCCDYVIKDKLYQFQKNKKRYYGYGDDSKTPLPMYTPSTMGRIEDNEYGDLFGSKGSLESVFEIAYDGSNNSNNNGLVTKFYGGMSGSTFKIGLVGGSALFQDVDGKPDLQSHAYSKTDLRAAESIRYVNNADAASNSFQVVKYIAQGIEVLDGTNVLKKDAGQPDNVNYSNIRTQSNMDANWIVYRVSDLLLMKAEAIACLYPDGDPKLKDAYDLTYAVLDRSNPAILPTDKLKYSSYGSAKSILDFVMRERQREFFGEGKRWFDLVRIAMRDNTTENMLNLLSAKYTTNASAIKAKLATLNSLYSPVYKNEMKINTALVQNPAWVVDETIVKN